MKNPTKTERKSDREVVTTRTFNGPARIVWEAWTKGDIFAKWWIPKSFPINVVSCEMDARVGGGYRLVLTAGPDHAKQMAFFGKYLEATAPTRLVWTNEESPDGAVNTLTLEEKDGKTFATMSELFPSKKAADDACASDAMSGYPQTFDQLDEMLGL